MLLRMFVGLVLLLPLGCASSAHRMFGTSNPSVSVSHNWLLGTQVEIGTDFQGEASGKYSPATKELEFSVKVASAPQMVIAAEAERINHMEKIREMEFAMLLEQTKAMTGMVNATVKALGDAVGVIGNVITPGASLVP